MWHLKREAIFDFLVNQWKRAKVYSQINNRVTMRLFQKLMFLVINAFIVILAVLPYAWTRLFGYEVDVITVEFGCAISWLVCFILALWTQHWRWRSCVLILIAAPFACWPAIVTLATLIIWHYNGFAP